MSKLRNMKTAFSTCYLPQKPKTKLLNGMCGYRYVAIITLTVSVYLPSKFQILATLRPTACVLLKKISESIFVHVPGPGLQLHN